MDKIQLAIEALEGSRAYIKHIGLNKTEKGEAHPQALLLEEIDLAIAQLKGLNHG